jgi:hypothetical protein
MKAILQELEPIVGESGICDWENLKPVWQERIARATSPEDFPSSIVYPSIAEELKSHNPRL